MKRYFLAVDPDGEHETGKVEAWSNRLHLTHEPRPVGSGYEVELTVKPSGQIRWNTDGTNAAEGKVYDGPIKLDGQSDTTIYAYAEAEGVTTRQEFRVNRRDGAGQKIDGERPALIRRQIRLNTTDRVFAATAKAKEAKVRFNTVVVVVGSGSSNITTAFAADVDVRAEAIEEAAKFARSQLGQEQAEVTLSWKTASFERAAEIDGFMAAIGESVERTEIEQK